MAIFKATTIDIDSIVNIHDQAFPDFFLTSLGDDFLKLYYSSVLKSPDGILLVCKSEDITIGFCAGTMLSAGFNTRIIKNNFARFMGKGIRLFFSRPIKLWHLYKNMSKENPEVGDKGNYAELLSIGVDPNKQGGGVGKQLLLALEREVISRGGLTLSLTTDYDNNTKAISFYRSLGYKEWYDFVTFPNRRMYRMVKQLN